jgi:hypothetical protein
LINGNTGSLIGPQRSMVDDVEYTFSEKVTLDPTTAFNIEVAQGQTGTIPTLNWAPINPDASGASTQWDVTFSGTSVIANSIANGVYVLTLNTAFVTSEANPILPAQAHNPDIFSRLFGDADGDGAFGTADQNAFATAMNNYSPIFDYNSDGAVNLADEFQASKNVHVTYTGTINFNPAALRPTDVAASVNGPTSVTLSWTGPSDPTVTGYAIQRWSASDGTWITLPDTVPAAPLPPPGIPPAYTFTDDTALPGVDYEYAVAAQAGNLASDWSVPSNDAVPTPVSGLVVKSTQTGVSLEWGATGYTVHRQGPGDDGFRPLTIPPTGTTFIDPAALPDATYNYYVTATLPAGESAPSNVVTAQTLSDPNNGNEILWNCSEAPQTADAYSSDATETAGGAELGVQFTPSANGYVTGMQFYKGPLNTGLHVGDLWDQYGTPMATATFANESESGWQQVDFSQPVHVTAYETYVASYSDTSGYFAGDEGYFDTGGPGAQGIARPDIAAPADHNGVELLDGTGSPGGSDGANYWVQPIFYPM